MKGFFLMFAVFSRLFFPTLQFYTENDNYESFSLPTTNLPFSDYYCETITSNLCESCFLSNSYAFFIYNSNKKCAYNKDLMPNIYYDPATNYAYAINPYCRIIPESSTIKQNDLSAYPSEVTLTPDSSSPTSLQHQCDFCYPITSPTGKKYSLLAALYPSDGTNYKDYCVVDCKEVPWAITLISSSFNYEICSSPFPNTPTSSCGTSCYYCSGDMSDLKCRECKYDLTRYGDLETHITSSPTDFREQVMSVGLTCSISRNTAANDLGTVFISPTEFACVASNNCDGSYSSPFQSLAALLKYLHQTVHIGEYTEITIKVLFMKGGNHYVLDKYISDSNPTPEYSYLKVDSAETYYLDELILRAFERVSSTITISSAYLNSDGCVSSSYCFSSGEKATLVWKSHLTSFWINKKLTFSKIIMDGSDLFPYVSYDPNTKTYGAESPYIYKQKQCCTCDSEGNCKQSSNLPDNSCLCGLKKQQIPISVFSKKYQEYNDYGSTDFHWHRRPYGIFNLEFLSDYSSASKPELIIEDCIFKNFEFHLYSPTLIAIAQNHASIVKIKSSTFFNFYHPYGLISNSYVPWLRDLPYYVNSAPQTCTDKSLTEPCYYLLIDSCVFNVSGRNASYVIWDPDDSVSRLETVSSIQNEGIVLFLNNFNGPITLNNNIFSNLITIMRAFSSGTATNLDCELDSTDNDLLSDPEQSIFIDYHMRYRIEKDNTRHQFTGSILNIRNLRLGLIITNNIFSDNVGFTGTALFLHQYDIYGGTDDTKASVILIEDNIFTRNMALRYGLNIVLINYEKDYLGIFNNNRCGGIQINGNTFSDNVGCPKTFGNVIISCNPEDVTARKPTYSTYDTTSQLSSTSYNMAYSFEITGSNNYDYTNDNTFWFRVLLDNVLSESFEENNYTLNIPPSPETSTSTREIDIMNLNIYDNVFQNNYAIVSNALYINSAPQVNLINNTFKDNSIPAASSSIYQITGYSKNIYLNNKLDFSVNSNLPLESSTLIVSLNIKGTIKNCLFSNNSASFFKGFYFGLAITVNKMIGGNEFKIENCVISNHLYDAISKNIVNSLSLISFGYLEYYGFSYTSYDANPDKASTYYKTFDGTFTINNCSFSKNSFEIDSLTNFDLSNSALINFFCDLATKTGIYSAAKDYSNGNSKTPVENFRVFISEIVCEYINVYDGRPLINIFFNNIFELKNVTISYVVVKDDSLWQPYGGFFCLYIIENSYDFSYNTYQINITNITIASSNGLIFNIYHPIQKASGTNPTSSDISDGVLNIQDVYITNHITTYTSFAFSKINCLNFFNILIDKITTVDGIFYFPEYQQTVVQDVTKVYIYNVTAYEIKSTNYAGFYLSGLLSAEITNITLKGIYFAFSNSLVSKDAAVCLYTDTYLPYISNFTCVNISISSTMTKNPSGNVIYSLCFTFSSISMNFNRDNELGSLNLIFCEYSKIDWTFNANSMPFYLASIKNSKNVNLIKSRFNQHSGLYAGIYDYNSQNIKFSYINFTYLKTYSSDSMMIALITGLSQLTFEYILVKNNYCEGCLGCFMVTDTSNFIISYSNISDNIANLSTGFYLKGSSILTMYGCNYLRNNATYGSAMIYSTLSSITITSSVFQENWSYSNGMKLIESTFTIKLSKFLSNYALFKSANLYASVNSEESLIWDCYFENPIGFYNGTSPTNSQKGFFIFINDAVVLIQETFFINGYSYKGGAIYFSSSTKMLSLDYVRFFNNSADFNGGAVYADGTVWITNSFFSNNSCLNEGSNIYLATNNYLYLLNSELNNSVFTSIYADQQCDVYILGSTISGIYFNIPIYGFICNICNNITIKSTTFSNFNGTSTSGAGIVIIGSTSTTNYEDSSFLSFNMETSTITNCISTKGPAVYISGKVMGNISSSTFVYNSAIYNSKESESGKGGAIYFDCPNIYCYLQFLDNNKFTSNIANVSGGAHYFTNMPILFADTTTTYYNNSAIYGNNQASYPVSIDFYTNAPSTLTDYLINRSLAENSYSLPNSYQIISSGTVITPIIVIKIIDEDGQVVSSDSSSILTVSSSDSTTTFGNSSQFRAVEGYYVLYPFSILSTPGTTASVSFTSSAISKKFQRTDLDFISTLNFSQSLRQCLKGEKRTDSLGCYACGEGTYSTYDFSDANYSGTVGCANCPIGAQCKGYYFIGADAGYWKFDSFSSTIFSCYNGAACAGAYLDNITDHFCKDLAENYIGFCFNGWCGEGYTGILCEDCADGWAQSDPNKRACVKCNDNPGYYVKSIFLSFLAIGMIVWSVLNSIRTIKKIEKKRKENMKALNQIVPIKNNENEGFNYKSPLYLRKIEVSPILINQKESNTKQPIDSPEPNPLIFSDSPEIDMHKNKSLKTINLIEDQNKSKEEEEKMDQVIEEGNRIKSLEDEAKEKEKEIKKEKEEENDDDIDRSAIYIKILFNYIQILAILGSFPFQWPQEIIDLFSQNKEAVSSSQSFFSIDCFLKQDVFSRVGLRVFWTKLLLYAVSPFGFFMISFAIWIIYFYAKYRSNIKQHKAEFTSYFITTMVILLFMVHPNIIQQDFSAFACIDLNDAQSFDYSSMNQNTKSKYYLQVDNQIKCWDNYHLSWCYQIATPSLIFWGFGIPVFGFYILWKNRHHLNDELMRSKYAFLYEGYKLNYYFWEFIILYRKILIIVCAVFMTDTGPEVQGSFVMGVSGFNYLFQVWFEPYDQDVLNEIEKRSLICSAFTLYCALFYIQSDVSDWYKVVLLVIILFLNCYFGIFWVKEFIRQKTRELLKNKYAEKYLGAILRHRFFSKKFVKGRHNIFDFDYKRVGRAKLFYSEKNQEIL